MRGLFAIDGNIYKYMLKLYEVMVLNLLFIIASLPIVTIGAALTALYDVTLRMQVGTEKEMTGSFVKSFKKKWHASYKNLADFSKFYCDSMLGHQSGEWSSSCAFPPFVSDCPISWELTLYLFFSCHV